jgi:hypothetical protein
MLEEGMQPKRIAEVLGYASPGFLQRYTKYAQ